MRLTETHGIVYVIKPDDYNAAGIDGDSFNMENVHHATILVQFEDLTGDSVLTVNSGASAGTKTTAETFTYRLASGDHAAANADQWGTAATSAALTLTAATYDQKMLAIEIPGGDYTDGQPWITINISDAATELFVSAVAILQPRYAPMPTAIA